MSPEYESSAVLLRRAALQHGLAGQAALEGEFVPRAKVFLQLGDCPAQRRLGDRQRLRGAAEMQPARHFAEVGELAQGKRKLMLSGHHRGLKEYFRL